MDDSLKCLLDALGLLDEPKDQPVNLSKEDTASKDQPVNLSKEDTAQENLLSFDWDVANATSQNIIQDSSQAQQEPEDLPEQFDIPEDFLEGPEQTNISPEQTNSTNTNPESTGADTTQDKTTTSDSSATLVTQDSSEQESGVTSNDSEQSTPDFDAPQEDIDDFDTPSENIDGFEEFTGESSFSNLDPNRNFNKTNDLNSYSSSDNLDDYFTGIDNGPASNVDELLKVSDDTVLISEEADIFESEPQDLVGIAIGTALNDVEELINYKDEETRSIEFEENKKLLEQEIIKEDIQIDNLRTKKKSMFDFGFDTESHISIAVEDDWLIEEDDEEESKPGKKKGFALFNKK